MTFGTPRVIFFALSHYQQKGASMTANTLVNNCRHGHDLTKQQPYRDANGCIRCRECQSRYSRDYRARLRAERELFRTIQKAIRDGAALEGRTIPDIQDVPNPGRRR